MTPIFIVTIIVFIIVVLLIFSLSLTGNKSLPKTLSNARIDSNTGKITWDSPSNINTYVLSVSSDEETNTYTTKENTFVIPNFVKKKIYNIHVTIQNDIGRGKPLLFIYDPPVPKPPKIIESKTIKNNLIKLSWEKTENTDYYSILLKDVSGKWVEVHKDIKQNEYYVSLTDFINKPITNLDMKNNIIRENYFVISVVSINDAGPSQIIPINAYPVPNPTNFGANLLNKGIIDFKWMSANEDEVDYYLLEYQTKLDKNKYNLKPERILQNHTNISISSLPRSEEYSFYLSSINKSGYRSDYEKVDLKIPPPPTIRSLRTNYLNNIITLNWDTSDVIYKYILKFMPNGSTSWQTVDAHIVMSSSQTSYSFNPSSLSPTQLSYNFGLIPIDEYGQEGQVIMTTVAISQISGSNFSANLSPNGNISLTWKASLNESYTVCYKPQGDTSWTIIDKDNITEKYINSINNFKISGLYTFGITKTDLTHISEVIVLIIPPPIVNTIRGEYIDGMARFHWKCSSIDAISQYTLRWKPLNQGTWNVISPTLNSSAESVDIKLSELGNYQQYEFSLIVTNCEALQSGSHNTVVISKPNSPHKPTMIGATYNVLENGEYGLIIQSTLVNGATSYTYKLSDLNHNILNIQENVTSLNSFLIKGITPSTFYIIHVASNGPSGQSEFHSIKTQAPCLPSIPEIAEIKEITPYNVLISWKNEDLSASYYDIEVYPPEWRIAPGCKGYSGTSCNLEFKDQSKNLYLIKITPYNIAGQKGESLICVYYPTPLITTEIRNVIYDSNLNKIKVSFKPVYLGCTDYLIEWEEKAANKSGSFMVEYGKDSAFCPEIPVHGYTYYFTIRLVNSDKRGPVSKTFMFITPSPSMPRLVKNIRASYNASDLALTIKWDPAEERPEIPNTISYIVQITIGGSSFNQTIDSSLTTTIFTNILYNDSILISIISKNIVGFSNMAIRNYTPSYPPSVSGVIASYKHNLGLIRLSWTPMFSSSEYIIRYKPKRSNEWNNVCQIQNITGINYYDITPWYFERISSDYDFTILSVDKNHNIGLPSNIASVNVGPPPIQNLVATYNSETKIVTVSCDSIPDVTQYEWNLIETLSGNTGKSFTSTHKTSFNDIKQDQQYIISVKASNRVASNQTTSIKLF